MNTQDIMVKTEAGWHDSLPRNKRHPTLLWHGLLLNPFLSLPSSAGCSPTLCWHQHLSQNPVGTLHRKEIHLSTSVCLYNHNFNSTVVKQWHSCPGRFGNTPCLEMLNTRLDGAHAPRVGALPMAGGWNQMVFKVSSNPTHSMVEISFKYSHEH